MQHPLVTLLKQVNPLFRETSQQSSAWNLGGVDEKTFRRWCAGAAPSLPKLADVAESLWKLMAHDKWSSKRKEVFAALRAMDAERPGEEVDQKLFISYFEDVGKRCVAELKLEVLVRQGRERDFRLVKEAAPVASGSQVCVRVECTHPLYVYVMWVESTGKVVPLYPWRAGGWQELGPWQPAQEVTLPQEVPYWEIDTPAGAETCVAMGTVFRQTEEQLAGLEARLARVQATTGARRLPAVKEFSLGNLAESDGQKLNLRPDVEDGEMLKWRHRDLGARLQAAAFDRVVGVSFSHTKPRA